jgi:methylphosphotriester-DNA--protein-cysteine methyltransferase
MIGLLCFVLAVLASPFKSKLRLEAENAVLRHKLIVLRGRLHGRVRLTNNDRCFAKTGRTPAKAIEVFRLEAARRLLEETEQGVDRIARSCGFGDTHSGKRKPARDR